MSIDNLADVILQEDVPLTVTRTATPTMALGRPTSAGTSTLAITASVQPMPTKELQFMPEGLRNRGVVKVFTTTELLTLPMPDRFDYGGATWEIVESQDWWDLGGYYAYTAARVTMT